MIKYKLICNNCETTFDSWFASSLEFEKLKRKNYLSCIHCNSKKIDKSLMSPLVIKTNSSFYIYPIEKTPLNLILDKDFLLKKIKKSNERILDDNLVNFKLFENDMEINLPILTS